MTPADTPAPDARVEAGARVLAAQEGYPEGVWTVFAPRTRLILAAADGASPGAGGEEDEQSGLKTIGALMRQRDRLSTAFAERTAECERLRERAEAMEAEIERNLDVIAAMAAADEPNQKIAEATERERDRLREALEPFGKFIEARDKLLCFAHRHPREVVVFCDGAELLLEDFRRARAALAPSDRPSEGGESC